MVKARKERRWARVATAVALCLPCSSFVIPLHAADIAQAKSSLASLPPMRTQSQLNREVQPVQRTVSHSAASPRSLPAMRTQSQYVSTQKAMPTQATARPERYASAPTAREFAPAPSTPAESRAALKKNADFFPPVTEYYKPDSAYAGCVVTAVRVKPPAACRRATVPAVRIRLFSCAAWWPERWRIARNCGPPQQR
ncbi:hypothetical protein [Enterobacter cloacae]|uniref:hypothetical protein n=1 Tax=Enterobacter cloacae TaxID=550 RepID=UPI0030BFFDEF